MRLINTLTAKPLVEFSEDQTVIHSKFLEREMRLMGIPVPHGLRGMYHGKECIRLEDEDFQKAFMEIYYLTAMNPETFRWEDA